MAINLADSAAPDPAQLAQLRKRLKAQDYSPSTRSQAYSYQFFQKLVGDLGNPFDLTRIPISVLKQMERDPVIAFALYFIHVPIIRAKWHIECSDARIAAFVDNSLRRILASYIRTRKQAMNYGFVPMIKRFQLENPDWKFIDPAQSDSEIPVWDNKNIDAITWKTFENLPSDPTVVEPNWSAKGEFNGIKYNGGANLIPFATVENSEDGSKTIPLSHSLWVTNERESVNGSLWGFPRIGHAYRFWWSYWFRWALFDRFFERKADPPYVVYYPVGRQGDFSETSENDTESMRDIALGIAESARAGGALAMPGDVIAGYDDRPTQMREWEIKELEVRGDMTHFTDSFEYLDIMKLRSMFISEFAVTEGQGGTSSRNTMSDQLEFQKEGAGALADEIDDELNRFVIPDLVHANFPKFEGSCRKITTSFAESDQTTMQQALQWIGQSDASALRNIDVRELLDRLGMPVVSQAEIHRQEQEAEKALQESQPQEITPQQGNAPINPQGFYVQPREQINLSSLDFAESKFLSSLPKSKHFIDKDVLQNANTLQKSWKEFYKSVYEDFAKFVSDISLSDLQFADRLDLDAKLVPNKPGVTNWVERKGGLPKKIADMAGDLITERGMSTSHAIAVAVSRAKVLCAKGNKEWCAAVAKWEKMKLEAPDEIIALSDEEFIGGLDLDAKLVPNKPGVTNWVERRGGLPKKIGDMAGDLITEKGMSVSHAIATAVSQAKKLCAKGNKEWCAALAKWEKMKVMASEDLLELNLADDAEKAALKMIKDWNFSRQQLNQILNESHNVVKNVITRAGAVELRKAGLNPEWQTDIQTVAAYLNDRGAEYVKAIDETVREELKTFLADAIRNNVGQDELANQIREHFADFPDWKANRLARSEIRNAYNFGTLAAGEQAGIKVVQAKDAQFGNSDPVCEDRNGRIFDISDALSETEKEHPNGTLEWILLRRENLSIEYVEEMPDGSNTLAYFDDRNNIVYLKNDIPIDVEKEYLLQLGNVLSK